MYKINSTKHTITLKAIDVNSKLNTKKNKNNQTFEDGNNIYFVIDKNNYCPACFWRALLHFFESLKKEINIEVNSFLKILDTKYHQGIITCLLSTSEIFNNRLSYKTFNKQNRVNNFIIHGNKQLVAISKTLVEAECWSNNLITMPSNLLTGDVFENHVIQKFKEFKSKIKITILHKKDLISKKMGLLLAVGQASKPENDPRMIIIEYKNANTKKISLIGKGILHDTGGLNLKPSNAMKNMHTDMSGAAIALGTIYALAKMNVKTNVTVVAPLTSNEINEKSYRMNDVIHSYSGKSIEITNTDAEGRLILADAITYASKDINSQTIVSIATLTGAIVVSFSNVFAGYWTSNNQQTKLVEDAASQGCELIWKMPFHNEFLQRLDSNIADYANCSNVREGSAIVAAEFLKIFVDDKNFIHFDIAGTNELKTVFLPSMLRTLFYLCKEYK